MEDRRAQRIAAFRAAITDRLSKLGVAWIQLESGVADEKMIPEVLRELHALKGEAGVLGFAAATELVHALEAAVQRGPVPNDDSVLGAFDSLGELFQADPAPATPAIRRLIEQLGGAAAARPAPSTRAGSHSVAPLGEAGGGRGVRRDKGARIGARQLDRMRDTIGDLATLRVHLTQLADQLASMRGTADGDVVASLKRAEAQARNDAMAFDNLLATLDETVRELRMVPLGMAFEGIPRLARDLGRDLGKTVKVELEGESAEVDRDVIEAVETALLHLVRNAIDHGLEPASKRASHGKPPQGTLKISASVTGRKLQLTVADDGAGIDVETVRRVAIKRGLVDESSRVPDERALQWILLPGFTTREQATHVSGRGVGLDAVHTSVQSFGGSLDVASVRGQGTTFRLSIPISSAIATVLLFTVGAGRFALPIGSIEDIVSARDHVIEHRLDGPVITYGGADVPVLDLGPIVGRPSTSTDHPRFLLVRTRSGLVACTGSDRHEHRDVVIRPAGTLFSDRQLVTGAITLEGGEVALALNPARLQIEKGRATLEATRPSRVVLVVDDSPIIRDLVSEVLRSHGLEVLEAADGVEASELFEARRDIALVVTDLDMPRMGGLELIQHLRSRRERRIPAVVVSARGGQADKQAAISVGADAYLVKTDLTHDSLWSLIARHVGTT